MRLLTALAILAPALAHAYCFSVKVTGHGRPVILIPGLTCTGEVWAGTVTKLQARYECHVLSLPGFGNQPPIEGAYLSHVRDDIIAYVKARHLTRPALIGHSLGGFMIYSLASTEPKLFGPLIAVDGLPFLSVLMNPKATVESMKPIAELFANSLRKAAPEKFKEQIRTNLAAEITATSDVDRQAKTCCLSNQSDVAEAIEEMMTTDLRDEAAAIESPLLLIGAGQSATTDARKQALSAAYQSQISKISHAKLVMDWRARHFVMLDDPEFFAKQVLDFLDTSWSHDFERSPETACARPANRL